MPTSTVTRIHVCIVRFHEHLPPVVVTDAPLLLDPNAESFPAALISAAQTLETMCRSFDALTTEPGWHHDWKTPAYPWLYHGASPDYVRTQLEA